jgi:hypothetical protein
MDRASSDITVSDLVGCWRLESWLIRYPGGREPVAPFGKAPSGQLLYSPDGWMSATVHRAHREPFPTGCSPRDLGNDVLAGAYRSYFHYAGRWRIEGECVIHSVRHSLNPGMVGSDQIRQMTLAEPLLTLAAEERYSGGKRRHELVWRRAEP